VSAEPPAPAVLVTGGSRGIGRAVAEALASGGERVVVAARESEAIEQTLSALEGGDHLGLELDVADAAAWPRAMAHIESQGGLSGLVTAAGVLAPVGPIGSYDPMEFRRTIEVNLLGTQLALHHALPSLRRTRGAAVTFSGGGATGPLPRYDAYAASKAAVVRLTENVAAVTATEGVRVNCVAPGFVTTRIHEATLAAGPNAAGPEYFERTLREREHGGVPASRAAELVCFLLGPRSHGISGKLLSAQWDPWEEEEFVERLAREPDLATLRRIDGRLFDRVRTG
jgi:3-oxoacyl-[acyl-carrier protein] reductase